MQYKDLSIQLESWFQYGMQKEARKTSNQNFSLIDRM